MKQRKKVRLDMDMVELLVTMGEGNPGGLSALTELAKRDDGLFHILHLDDMNMRGSQIWVGYNDHCKRDIGKFVECIKSRDKEMVSVVNRECLAETGHEAVTNGGSWR